MAAAEAGTVIEAGAEEEEWSTYRGIQQDPAEVAAVQGEEGAVCEHPVALPGDQVEVVLLAGPGRQGATQCGAQFRTRHLQLVRHHTGISLKLISLNHSGMSARPKLKMR